MSQDIDEIYRRIDTYLLHKYKDNPRWPLFKSRFSESFPRLYELLETLYGTSYDLNDFTAMLVEDAWQAFAERSELLLKSDLRQTESQEPWYLSHEQVGAVCYVDRFAGDFRRLREKIGYLEKLGITYLHLMPCYRTVSHESDGGYAVADYREFQEGLGSREDFCELARDLHRSGIRLSMDFVLNHTSDNHAWAVKAAQNDPYYRNFYYIIDNFEDMESYNRHLREIFPEVRRGSFTWKEGLKAWVWTTFNSFQWDLNYGNHEVFRSIVKEMLFLANLGADVLRFDAIAFLWKERGTRCESLPKVHTLIKALKAAAGLAVPALLFKSEAIVHPDEVQRYIGQEQCAMSYNPLLMALSWEALATRNPELLRKSIIDRMDIPDRCTWINYVRCHDDIGWTFDDEDARNLGIDPHGHRQFLNHFYTGKFPGSFARGLPFQENASTGDCRISGTCASLAGVEDAIERKRLEGAAGGDVDMLLDHALRRIRLLHGIAASMGGVPLLYLGDEQGQLNDYSFRERTELTDDSRWVHRGNFNWELVDHPEDGNGIESRIYSAVRQILHVRKQVPAFGGADRRVVNCGNSRVLGFVRSSMKRDILVLANFSDSEQVCRFNQLVSVESGGLFRDLLSSRVFDDDIVMSPWDLLWLDLVNPD